MAGRAAATAACTIAWIWSCNVAAVMVAVDAAPATAGARVPVTVGGTVDATVTARCGVEAEADVVADKVNVGNSGRSLHSRSLFSDSRSNCLQTCAVFWYTIQLLTYKN